jgi:hypothetical protein
MSKSDTFENDWLKLIFNATTIANLANDATSAPLTNLYVALHTSDPGETGTQSTNEVTTGQDNTYARVAVARTTGGWTVTNNSVSPAATIAFAAMVSGTGTTATHWSVGVASSGATKILYSGTITPNIVIAAGVTPQLTTATAVTED